MYWKVYKRRSFSLILKNLSAQTLKLTESKTYFCRLELNFVSQNLRTDTWYDRWSFKIRA